MERDDDNEADSDQGQKHKDITPLWKYVTRLVGGKGGGTTKFICPHCTKTYTSSYSNVIKHLFRIMPCDQCKAVGVKTCYKLLGKEKQIHAERRGRSKQIQEIKG